MTNQKSKNSWAYPKPGEWVTVKDTTGIENEGVKVGHKLYFRAISPTGLFECYSPIIDDVFCIEPQNVPPPSEINKALESKVPEQFTINKMAEIYHMGWKAWQQNRGEKK